MEEGLDYKTVTFYSNTVYTHEKPIHSEIIYDEVKAQEHECDTDVVLSEKEASAPSCARLHLLAGFGIAGVILISVIIFLCISLNTVRSDRERENFSFQREREELVRQREELVKERDGLAWTFGVILEHEDFPVHKYCSQNGSCKPCLDKWILFQSNCYLFSEGNFSSLWKTWNESQTMCREFTADLLEIDSEEEQQFVSNHTKYYNDEKHGYWIGLVKEKLNWWTWLEKRNLTVSYWKGKESRVDSCGLSLPGADPLASWKNMNCTMKNRWICERRALIKPN